MGAITVVLLAIAPAAGKLPGLVPTMAGDGLRIGPAGRLMPFGTPRVSALRQLREIWGKPVSTRTIADCGQGAPMTEVRYRGGVIVTFLKGRFSGWDLADKGVLKTDRGLANGATRAAVSKAYPDASVDDGPLGVTFSTEDGVMGFLDADRPNARVTALFAGETCKVA